MVLCVWPVPHRTCLIMCLTYVNCDLSDFDGPGRAQVQRLHCAQLQDDENDSNSYKKLVFDRIVLHSRTSPSNLYMSEIRAYQKINNVKYEKGNGIAIMFMLIPSIITKHISRRWK
jgi:hypothetical protein